MTKQNELRDILHKASLDASKPGMEEVWDEVLEQLEEQMPAKRKKRRFLYFFFMLFFISAFSGVIFISKHYKAGGQEATAISNRTLMFQRIIHGFQHHVHAEYPANSTAKKTSGNEDYRTHEKTGAIEPHAFSDRNIHSPGQPLKRETQKTVTSLMHGPEIFSGQLPLNKYDLFEEVVPGKDILPDKSNQQANEIIVADSHVNEVQIPPDSVVKKDNDSTQSKDGEDKNDNKVKRNFSIGGIAGYSFNNFTGTENRNKHRFTNSMYQVEKQIGINLYCRIPLGRLYQLQPELGVQPYSTDIQVNYRTPGLSVFKRYNLKRMIYVQFGLSNYLEIRKNIYLLGGFYGAYALPTYGAQLELVSQPAQQSEQILSSSYERKDFRKNVFDLRRSDFGILGGIECHRKRLTGSLRIYRGFMDITPETPSVYHNFSFSFGLGYHFEFRKE